MAKLSIIILNYNTEDFLYKCLTSLYKTKTTLQDEWEIIVVDNASNVTPDVSKYAKTRLIKNAENSGFAKANNKALKQARGEYVLILNPDTIVSQETLSSLLATLDKNPSIGIITPFVRLTTGEIDDASHRGFPTPWRALTHFSGLGRLFPHSMILNGYHLGYQHMDVQHEIEACVGACMIVRSSVGKSLHWFDEDYFWYGEDIDLCYRTYQSGHKIMFDPTVEIIHYKGVASGIKKQTKELTTASKETKIRSQKARVEAMRIFYKKHYKNKYSKFTTAIVGKGMDLLEWIFSKKT